MIHKESVTLEDFVCQAAVAERRLSSSPNSPPPFAIFTSTPNLAYRYQLYNGHVSGLWNGFFKIIDNLIVSQDTASFQR